MTKDEAVNAFRLAIYTRWLSNVPENATATMLETARESADLYSRMSADHLEHNFDVYESIFRDYLAERWDFTARIKP